MRRNDASQRMFHYLLLCFYQFPVTNAYRSICSFHDIIATPRTTTTNALELRVVAFSLYLSTTGKFPPLRYLLTFTLHSSLASMPPKHIHPLYDPHNPFDQHNVADRSVYFDDENEDEERYIEGEDGTIYNSRGKEV